MPLKVKSAMQHLKDAVQINNSGVCANYKVHNIRHYCIIVRKIEEVAEKLGTKFSDLVTDTDAEPQPVVSGYIEFAGEIVKISSIEDIERVLERIKATQKA